MHYYVYIIESLVDGSFYKGFTLDFNERVKQHNEGWSNYTSRKIPWKLVHLEIYETKAEALKREVAVKKYSHKQIESLRKSPKNCLNKLAERNPQSLGD